MFHCLVTQKTECNVCFEKVKNTIKCYQCVFRMCKKCFSEYTDQEYESGFPKTECPACRIPKGFKFSGLIRDFEVREKNALVKAVLRNSIGQNELVVYDVPSASYIILP